MWCRVQGAGCRMKRQAAWGRCTKFQQGNTRKGMYARQSVSELDFSFNGFKGDVMTWILFPGRQFPENENIRLYVREEECE